MEGLVWRAPCSLFLARHTPMKTKLILVIRIPCHKIDGEHMLSNLYMLLGIVIMINFFIIIGV
jgi:hypothetical protein